MIENLAEVLAKKIKAANPQETVSVERMKYALSNYISLLLIIGVSALIGVLTGKFIDTLVSLGSFMLLRVVSGGHHAKNMTTCFVISTIILSAIPHLTLPINIVLVNMFTLIMVTLFAPLLVEQINMPVKARPYLKILSMLIVAVNFFIGSSTSTLSMFVQALLIIPLRKEVSKS